jgi:hypothetical protein
MPQSSRRTELRRGGAQAQRKTIRKRPTKVVLAVACSRSKRLSPPAELELRSVEGAPDERRKEWSRRLQQVEAQYERAEDLYMGDHWRTACEAFRLALRYSNRVEFWVISAGYGLIRGTKSIKPYSATFATGSVDSVWRGTDDGDRKQTLRRWWGSLGHDGTLADLLRGESDGALVLCGGAAYLSALESELDDALQNDTSGDRIAVLSAGGNGNCARLPVSAQLRQAVGGTNIALNARLLRFLAAEAATHRFRRSAMAASLGRLAASSPPAPRPKGVSATDEEVASVIRQMRNRDPHMSRTAGLDSLRKKGIACEQSRFAGLWNAGSAAFDVHFGG